MHHEKIDLEELYQYRLSKRMIISKSISDVLTENIDKHWGKDIEIEISLGNGIIRSQFRRSLEYMLSICDSHHEHDEVLDVSLDRVRFTIDGKANIVDFCKKEKESVISSTMKKDLLYKLDIDEYGCRIRIAKETEVEDRYNFSAEKFYRFKKRFSTSFNNSYRVDFTIVKSGKGKKFTDVVFGPETYEIEIEYEGKGRKPALSDLLDITEEVMKSTRDEMHLTRRSEQGRVLKEYYDSVKDLLALKGSMDETVKHGPRKMFIGPQPVTLTPENVKAIFVGGDYMVTDKADGQRFLACVNSQDSKLYLINGKMDIKNTDIQCGKQWGKAIFDCEVAKVADGTYWIMLFDCYLGKGGVAEYSKNLGERLEVVKEFAKTGTGTAEVGGYALKAKEFFEDVKKGAKKILKKTGDSSYKTDGLIYTPTKAAKLGGTWNEVFKWKPPADNSIDFLVMYQRLDNGQDIVTSDNKKTLLLYVGSVTAGAKQYFEKTIKGYCAKLFTPAGAGEHNTWFVNMGFVGETGLVKCENGDEIIHKSVVEMRWDTDNLKWVPMRVRSDKTEESQGGKIITANSIQNAESVWKTIVSPIPEGVVTGTMPPQVEEDSGELDKYYARDIDRNQSLTLPMMTFHNYWVKNKCLIGKLSSHCNSILDLACGKGGDLSKWIFGGYKTVVGIDVFEDNINNPTDGAYRRLMDFTGKLPAGAKYAFVPMDSSKVIDEDQIERIRDDYMKKLARTLWGIDRNPPAPLKHLAGVANEKFDVVSVQFALHYFFENDTKLNNFIENVNNNIKGGGYFIGTCFDGNAVANLLADVEEGGVKTGMKDNKKIWSIKKKYADYDPSAVGQEIEVYVETINQYHKEFLVNYEVLKNRLAKYDIYPLASDKRFGFTEPYGRFNMLFQRMIDENQDIIKKAHDRNYKDNNILKAYKMLDCEDERTFSFLNMWFIFEKHAAATEVKAPAAPKVRKPRVAKPK